MDAKKELQRLNSARTDLRHFLQTPAGRLSAATRDTLRSALQRDFPDPGGSHALQKELAGTARDKLGGEKPEGRSHALAPSPRGTIIAPRIESSGDLGRLVKEARISMGLSQQSFADLASVGRRFLGELESGKQSVELGKVLAVCKAAGIDLLARRR